MQHFGTLPFSKHPWLLLNYIVLLVLFSQHFTANFIFQLVFCCYILLQLAFCYYFYILAIAFILLLSRLTSILLLLFHFSWRFATIFTSELAFCCIFTVQLAFYFYHFHFLAKVLSQANVLVLVVFSNCKQLAIQVAFCSTQLAFWYVQLVFCFFQLSFSFFRGFPPTHSAQSSRCVQQKLFLCSFITEPRLESDETVDSLRRLFVFSLSCLFLSHDLLVFMATMTQSQTLKNGTAPKGADR